MEVYEFDKNCLVRLNELLSVLDCKNGPVQSSLIKTQWSYHLELQMEPTGWQAVWKISRVICEELKINYPTVVYGNVDHVHFKDLTAVFKIIAVQDENVHIPECHIVPLQDIFPTIEQENNALNVDMTANCMDQMRFFYNNIWMPWDNDNDDSFDWEERHLNNRIKFYFDLKMKNINRRLSTRITSLLTEARYLQKRKEYLEIGLSDDEDEAIEEENTSVGEMMRLHLRMNTIKSEIEMFENPVMRKAFEENNCKTKIECKNFLVTNVGKLSDVITYLTEAKTFIGNENIKLGSSLQDALEFCLASDTIYIPAGIHQIKFMEHFNEKGSIKALVVSENNLDEKINSVIDLNRDAVIKSKDEDSILITVDGEFTFENITFDCKNVRSGILIRNGNVVFKNCCIIGDSNSSTKQGLCVFGNSLVKFENSIIKDFSTGITLNAGSKVYLDSSIISNCYTGVEVNENAFLAMENSKVKNSKTYGISLNTTMAECDEKKIIYTKSDELKE